MIKTGDKASCGLYCETVLCITLCVKYHYETNPEGRHKKANENKKNTFLVELK
jgi:hypothetical protein